MTSKIKLPVGIVAAGVLGLTLLSGCCTQSAPKTTSVAPAPAEPAQPTAVVAPAPAPAPAVSYSNFGPSHSTYEEGGIKYIKGSMAFPTGMPDSSGLLLEKIVPAEVLVGQQFEYVYRVTNLTDFPIRDVVITDYVTDNFRPDSADPAASAVQSGMARWDLGELDARETKIIRVTGSGNAEGRITTCAIATYNPVLCESINVVKADLELVKTAPAAVLLCDDIPINITVRNSGSSALTGVTVTDTLPEGMTSTGQTTFDVGTLAAGESRDLQIMARATRTGRFNNVAKATSAQGVEAEDSAMTVVSQPVLTITCDMPSDRFVGRPINACYTISNTGDAACSDTVVEVPLPAGISFQGATAGGTLVGNKIVWNLGALPAGEQKEVCATVTATQIGSATMTATASCYCAGPVSSTCSTEVTGIPAILLEVIDLDDPIEAGSVETYVITVTNQGSAPGTNIRVSCELEEEQSFISGTGTTAVSGSDNKITMAPVASLAAKAKAEWRVNVKAVSPANVRFKVIMISDQLTRTVEETESTNQY